MVKIGCQTITWGPEKNRNNILDIIKEVKQIGYEGIEIGARHLNPEMIDVYNRALKEADLKLIALHSGGDFLDSSSVSVQMKNIDTTIEMIKRLEGEYLFLSGTYKENKTIDDYKTEAKVYNEIGKKCADNGIKLCYHNHNWEFFNEMIGYKILVEETDERIVNFVVDVGWVTMGGYDPIKLIKDIYERVEAVHFKDFTSEGEITELGSGVVDFKGIYEVIKHKRNMWIIAEQDVTKRTPLESVTMNYNYIHKLLEN